MSLYDFLEKADSHLLSLEKGKRYIIYATIFLGIGYIFYALFFDPLLQQIESSKEQLAITQSKIQRYAPTAYLRKIKKIKKELLQMQTTIDTLHAQKLALQSRLDANHFVFLDNPQFTSMLDHILYNSVKYDVQLFEVKLTDMDREYIGKLYIKKRVDINGSGSFLNIVRFIRTIEDQNTLLKVDHLLIDTNGSKPQFQCKVHFFGVRS